MIFHNKIFTSYLLFFFLLHGCSGKPITLTEISDIADDISNVFNKDDSGDYGNSKSIANLEIPPSLDSPNYSNAINVPRAINAKGELSDLSNAPILPKYMNMQIVKQGIARWLEIDSDPATLWPYINEFLKSQGYEIILSEPLNGTIETEWKKTEIIFDTESDFLSNQDTNYSAAKEKFRVRLERQPNGYVSLYLSNHLLQAEDVLSNGNIIWKQKEPDLYREAEMLVRIMEYFGTKRDIALKSLKDSEKNDKNLYIDLIDFYGVPALLLKDSYSKMWREIGLSLDRNRFFITDTNRNKAIYTVTTNMIEGKEVSYEIKLTKRDNNNYIVTVHSVDKLNKISYENAKKILKHILFSYSSKNVKN